MATTVEGLARLQARFAKIPKEMRAEVRIAIDRGADELVAMQSRLAADDPATGPPDLHTSNRKRPGRHDLSVEVINDNFKALWHEFGTVKMQARPFFFPSFRALRRRIRSRISRAVTKAVRR